MQHTWLLQTTDSFIPKYMAINRHGRPVWVWDPNDAERFESEHHAYQNITTDMKFRGIIARRHSVA
ncbi:hypothetical protein [Bowmanella dokdonensis]|uniref:Uncharacterized protein n=1 Tax=Bowmanella dokdonensis TaxID=751969 RepID=A0A939DMD3_9ALTE|nr:hypothetical protein [Bowmanella dokdonensis]MBN7824770.1 hypothetical protein [Bowmanella dokdonensis]